MPWYPTPPNDNGFGLHDTGNASPGEVTFMRGVIDAMKDKNFHWLKLITTVDPNNERKLLARHARDKGIMPICRPYRQEPHPNNLHLFEEFIKAWLDQGCPYFEVGNEPDLRSEVTKPYADYKYGNKTGVPAFAELLLDQWMRNADMIRSLGGIPLFPAMSPTSWTGKPCIFHHELYKLVLDAAKARGILAAAFEGAGVAIHNRPCEGMELDEIDPCAFQDYIWIENTFRSYLERDIPLFATEAGYEGGMVTDWFRNHGILAPPAEMCLQKHRELNHEIFLRFNPAHSKAWKKYLVCECMWLTIDGAWHGAGWVSNGWANGGESHAWRYMKDIAPFTRSDPAPQPPPEPPPEPPEPGPEPPEPHPNGGEEVPYTLKARLEKAPYGFEDLRSQVAEISDMEAVKAESLAAKRIDAAGNPLFHRIRYIVVHHMGGAYYGALELVRWAVGGGDPEVDHATSPYHFVIEKSGKILWLVAIKYLTHHAAGANSEGIGICFEDEATEEQMEAGRFLVAALYEFFGQDWGEFRLTGLLPHKMVWNGKPSHTECPGAVWPKILWSGPWPKLRGPL